MPSPDLGVFLCHLDNPEQPCPCHGRTMTIIWNLWAFEHPNDHLRILARRNVWREEQDRNGSPRLQGTGTMEQLPWGIPVGQIAGIFHESPPYCWFGFPKKGVWVDKWSHKSTFWSWKWRAPWLTGLLRWRREIVGGREIRTQLQEAREWARGRQKPSIALGEPQDWEARWSVWEVLISAVTKT